MFVLRYQLATSVPLLSRMTDGTSAQLTNQSVPEATVAGVDHVLPARSANLSVDDLPFRSSQLRITPWSLVVSCGSLLPAAAPVESGWTVTFHAAGAGGAAGVF